MYSCLWLFIVTAATKQNLNVTGSVVIHSDSAYQQLIMQNVHCGYSSWEWIGLLWISGLFHWNGILQWNTGRP